MDSIKNVIKDLQNILLDVESLERLKKAREEDVQHLEAYVEQRKMEFYKLERKYNKICNECKLLQNANQEWNDLHVQRNKEIAHLEQCIEKLQKQNVQLSEQVEKHLEEKSNGNWAKEGAVVWHGKHKMKGVLLANERGELYVMGFKEGKGFNILFKPYTGQIEPYKGQDKEEVKDEPKPIVNVGQMWIHNEDKDRIIVIYKDIDETGYYKAINLLNNSRLNQGQKEFVNFEYLVSNYTKKDLD